MSLQDHGYEAHITLRREDAEAVEALADALPTWHFSQIHGDPVLGRSPFCYLTSHDHIYGSLYAAMRGVENTLKAAGLIPVRLKIEHIVFDERAL